MNILIRLVLVLLVGVVGCKKDKQDEDLANKAGAKVGETITGFASGVGKGFDKQMTVVTELSPALAEQGISKTVSKFSFQEAPASGPSDPTQAGKAISVYMIAAKPFKATLVARAINNEGQEIGRSTADVDFAADDAKYIIFRFSDEMDTRMVAKYVIDAKK